MFFNFLSARVWQAVSFQPLHRIQFSNAHFFRFVLRIVCLKNIGPFCHFGPFWAIFPIFFFYFFFNFWFFAFFKYLMMSKISVILCIWKVSSIPLIWPLFESNFVDMKERSGIIKLFSIFLNLLLEFVSPAVSLQPLYRIHYTNAHYFRFVLRINRVKKIPPFCLFGPF